jgi:hypothetical protein
MIGLFWEIYQQYQINTLQAGERLGPAEAQRIARREAATQIQELASRVDKLTLVTHAMWTLLSERTNVTEEDLVRRVTELDGQDGSVDGKVTRPPQKCSCGAMVCTKFQRCLFCGKQYQGSGAAFV